jgi:hypothetical protein
VKAYICVYRHGVPSRAELERTRFAANADSRVQCFLDRYDDSDCFYDWGDDPGFFAAEQIFGTAEYASWGVCRPDVRSYLSKGDFVVFFCAKQSVDQRHHWDYFLVALATVKDTIARDTLWTAPRYNKYRQFYNVLAELKGNELVQRETFHAYHADWPRRAKAPYVIFDPTFTRVEMNEPLHVATKSASERVERWFLHQPDVRKIENLLFISLESQGVSGLRIPIFRTLTSLFITG